MPALGLDGRFIDALADAVIEALPGLSVSAQPCTPGSWGVLGVSMILRRSHALTCAPLRPLLPPPCRSAQTPTVRAINEGTPVSLRIINDLVALSRKEELKQPPKRERYGFTDTAERINGRIAMTAIALFGVGALPSLLELLRSLE